MVPLLTIRGQMQEKFAVIFLPIVFSSKLVATRKGL
jgi:hypothetical protein